MSQIHFEATFDASKLVAGINQANQAVDQWARNSVRGGESVEQMFDRMKTAATAYLSLRFGYQMANEIVSVRGEFQQLGIAFETMLGSKEKADKLMREQIVFSQKTPYTLTEVANNTKQLMAMGVAYKDVMATMKSLGDVAAGVSVPISRVAINYGQVMTLGKLQEREVRDFAMAGIPLIDELANNLGKTKAEITDMITASQITSAEVTKAFQTMSGEGGKFYNLMEKQNASVTGQISNLQDKIQVMMNNLGKSNEGLIYGGISGLTELVTHYQDILDTLKVLVATYGMYRAALIASSAAQGLQLLTTQVQEWYQMGKALGFATANQIAFNEAVLANPYVAAAVGITALITGLVVFSEKAKTTEQIVADLNKSMDEIGKQIEVESAINKYESLKDKVGKTKEEQDELNKTIKTLSAIFPDAIGKTDQYGKAIDLVTEKLKNASAETRKNTKDLAEAAKVEAEAAKQRLQNEKTLLQGELKNGRFTSDAKSGLSQQISLTPEEALANKKRIAELDEQISKLGETIGEESSKIYELASVGAESFIAKNARLFKEVDKYSREAALKTSAELLSMLGSEGGRADQAILKQVSALKEYANSIKTVDKELSSLRERLAKGEQDLKKMRLPGYESTDPKKSIEDQEAINQDLKDKIEVLTGVKEKQKKAVDELKTAQEQLDKAIIAGNQKEIQYLSAKIALLEKEKQLREWIAYEAIAFAKGDISQADRDAANKPTPIATKGIQPITPKGTTKTVNGILYEVTAIDKTGPVWTKVKAQYADLKKFEKDQDKKADEAQQKLDEENQKRKERFQDDLLNYSRQFTSELIDQLGLTQEQSKELQGIADTIFNLASGNYLAAGFSAASTLLTAIFSGSGKTDATTKALERTNQLLSQQAAILSNMEGGSSYFELATKQYEDYGKAIDLTNKKLIDSGVLTKDESEKLKAVYALKPAEYTGTDQFEKAKYKKELAEFQAAYAQFKKDTDKSLWTPEDFINAYAEGSLLLDQQQIDWITEITEKQKQRAELLQETFRQAMGFDSSDVADTILQGIEDGLHLAEDNSLGTFAKSFGEKIKEALEQNILEAMNLKLTEGFMGNFKNFLDESSAGGTTLTPDELAQLEKDWASAAQYGSDAMKAIQPILDKYGVGAGSSSSTALTGVSAQITEETGSIIAGIGTAIRIDIKTIVDQGNEQLDGMNISIGHLAAIEKNTNELSRLSKLEDAIKETNRILNDKLS